MAASQVLGLDNSLLFFFVCLGFFGGFQVQELCFVASCFFALKVGVSDYGQVRWDKVVWVELEHEKLGEGLDQYWCTQL